jgi:hypothetical protein
MNSSGELEATGTSAHRASHATVACPTCGTYQSVEIDYDHGQGCALVPVMPCSVCYRDLCCFCEQIICECGQNVCLQCTVVVADGTPDGLRLCQPCAQQSDPLCSNCGEFARMIPCENSEQRWFECSACGAAIAEDEIDSVQPTTAPRRQPGIAHEQERGGMCPEVA